MTCPLLRLPEALVFRATLRQNSVMSPQAYLMGYSCSRYRYFIIISANIPKLLILVLPLLKCCLIGLTDRVGCGAIATYAVLCQAASSPPASGSPTPVCCSCELCTTLGSSRAAPRFSRCVPILQRSRRRNGLLAPRTSWARHAWSCTGRTAGAPPRLVSWSATVICALISGNFIF